MVGSWIIREGDYKWYGPTIFKSEYSNQFIFEFFYKRIVISWWTQKQMTPEEEARQDQENWKAWQEYRKDQDVELEVRERWNQTRANLEKARLEKQDTSV